MVSKLELVAGYLRAFLFMIWLVMSGFAITIFMIVAYPILVVFDKKWQVGQHLCTGSQRLLPALMMNLRVKGKENIPKDFESVVIVSNHQSTLDMAVLAYFWYIPFIVTFKKELLFYPGMGTAMFLSGYFYVNRSDKNSGKQLIERCVGALRSGKNCLFFPEGTRKADSDKGPLGAFKAGAFLAASEANSRILPVTISGARKIFPTKGFPWFGFGSPCLTIHPPIDPTGKSVSELMEQCRETIISGLEPIDFDGVKTPTEPAQEDKKEL